MKTKVFTRYKGSSSYYTKGGTTGIAIDFAMFKTLHIPKSARKLQAVFTKEQNESSVEVLNGGAFVEEDFPKGVVPNLPYFHLLYW